MGSDDSELWRERRRFMEECRRLTAERDRAEVEAIPHASPPPAPPVPADAEAVRLIGIEGGTDRLMVVPLPAPETLVLPISLSPRSLLRSEAVVDDPIRVATYSRTGRDDDGALRYERVS